MNQKICVLSAFLAISSGLSLASADEQVFDIVDAKSADALHRIETSQEAAERNRELQTERMREALQSLRCLDYDLCRLKRIARENAGRYGDAKQNLDSDESKRHRTGCTIAIGTIKDALAQGADPNGQFADPFCGSLNSFVFGALKCSYVYSNILVRELVRYRADLNVYDDFSGSPVKYMAYQPKYLPLIKFFVRRGADVNRRSPLLFVSAGSQVSLFNYLLSRGADVDAKGNEVRIWGDHVTPVAEAASYGKKYQVIALLLLGANPAIESRFEVNESYEPVRYAYFTAAECIRPVEKMRVAHSGNSFRTFRKNNSIASIENLFTLSKQELVDLLSPHQKNVLAHIYKNHLVHQRRRATLDDAFIMHALGRTEPLRAVFDLPNGVPVEHVMEYINDSMHTKPDLSLRIPFGHPDHPCPKEGKQLLADKKQ